jgi:hypothetical protein
MVVVKLTGRVSILKDTLSIYLLSAMKAANETALQSCFRARLDAWRNEAASDERGEKMTEVMTEKLRMAANGVWEAIGPEDRRLFAYYESLVAPDYDRCHPGDTFEAMKFRARFSKEDQGLLRQWMAIAAVRAAKLPRQLRGAQADRVAA